MASADDHALAARLADDTGALLCGLLDDDAGPQDWSIEYRGDREAHDYLIEQLGRHRPGDAVLSEEGHDDRQRLDGSRVWIVDPLDGSSDFGWSGAWSVHVALCEDGEATAGAVAVPVWNTTFGTDPPAEPTMSRFGRRRVLVSRSRRHIDGSILAAGLDAEVAAMGSAGVKAMAVVRGEVDAYVHGGGLYEWDTCAPCVVAQAAGFHVSHADGSPLTFNKPEPWSDGLVVCRRDFAEEVLHVLTAAKG